MIERQQLIDSINRTVDRHQTLGAEEIANGIIDDVLEPKIKRDLEFLQEMKNHLQPAREKDKVSFDHLSEMIEDWINELNEQL